MAGGANPTSFARVIPLLPKPVANDEPVGFSGETRRSESDVSTIGARHSGVQSCTTHQHPEAPSVDELIEAREVGGLAQELQ